MPRVNYMSANGATYLRIEKDRKKDAYCATARSLIRQTHIGNILPMIVGIIEKFNRLRPFIPYQIRMASGVSYSVPHPDFVSVSPGGAFIVIADAEERRHHLNTALIKEIMPSDR